MSTIAKGEWHPKPRPAWVHRPRLDMTVLLKSIRQSPVTGVLDVTNFGTLSRVTEALDEYTFRHGQFKISVQGCSEQVSLAVDTLPSRFQGLFQTSRVSCFRPNSTEVQQ
jgi:hypothetical protein